MRSFSWSLSMLISVCVLSPAQLEHVLNFTSSRLCFEGVLRGRFVPRSWFDHVPAGTVLAEHDSLEPVHTTRNGVYQEHVLFWEHVPAGTVPRSSGNARSVYMGVWACSQRSELWSVLGLGWWGMWLGSCQSWRTKVGICSWQLQRRSGVTEQGEVLASWFEPYGCSWGNVAGLKNQKSYLGTKFERMAFIRQ